MAPPSEWVSGVFEVGTLLIWEDFKEEKCAQIQGQDVAVFFGGAGSGKTTVLKYAQGVNYHCKSLKLVGSHEIKGFEESDRRADVTRGLAFAEIEGIVYVDSAGQQATGGPLAELCGAINRCAVLQKAQSIRVALVLKDAKLDVGVGTLAEQIPEDDDLSLVQQLVQQKLSVFPVNVIDAQQRGAFHAWIRCLQPEYKLPAECSAEMESQLGRWSYSINQSIASHRYKWVLNNELVQQVVDHLDLSGILARDLLPRAQLIRKDVCTMLVRQNESCVETLKEGLCRGQLGELDQALHVLASMDAFRQSCGPTVNGQLSGWLTKAAALQRCIEATEKALNDQLPNKSWSRPFLSHQALEVGSIFAGLKMLEDPRAVKLLESSLAAVCWAQIFWEHLAQLNERASECSSPQRTVQALRELLHLSQMLLVAQEYLSQPVLPRLSQHHPSLRDFDFQVFLAQTKDQVVEKRRASPSGAPEMWQKLQELCRLSFDELILVLKGQVKEIKEGRRLPSSGASTDSTTDDDLPNVENSEAENIKGALDQLKMLRLNGKNGWIFGVWPPKQPFDILLIQLGDVVCVSATTFSLGNCLERKFRSSLDAAEREQGRKKWGSRALVLQDLARHMSQVLESTDLVEELKKLQEGSDWKHASTGTKSWLADFAQHVRNAKKFDQLLYRIDGVEEAREELLRKIECLGKNCGQMALQTKRLSRDRTPLQWSFHKNVLETAGTAADQRDWPQLVTSLRDGLAFEESELFRLLPRFKKSKDFREMAETQAWPVARRPLRPVVGQPGLQDFEKAERLVQVRRELDSALNDAESKLLDEVEDVCPAAKKLRTLTRVDTRAIANQQIASLAPCRAQQHVTPSEMTVEREWEEVQGKLKSLQEEAASNLHKALEGARPPNHALHIYAALSGKSKVAAGRDAMEQFAAAKKSEFLSMNGEQLMQWIEQHNHTWTSKDMPEELTKTSNSYWVCDLLQAFMQNFQRSFKTERDEMDDMQDRSEWQSAKAKCEDLRDALQMAEKLELLKPFSSQLISLILGHAGTCCVVSFIGDSLLFASTERSLVPKHKAKFEEKLDYAMKAILSAASSTERDLKLASKDQRQEVQEGLDAFQKAIRDATEKVSKLDRANLQVHLEPMKRWLKVFTALSEEHQKVLSQELGFGPGLLKWMEEILSPYCAKALSAEALLPLRLSVHVQELETKFKKEVLDGCRHAITSAHDVKDAADGCEALRKLADQARDTYDLVRSALESALNDLGRTVRFQKGGMLLLEQQLHLTPVGQVILAEHPGVFGAVKDAVNNEIFCGAAGMLDPGEVVGRLTRESKLNEQEQHEKSLAELAKKYLLGGKTLEQLKEKARADLREAVKACATNTCGSVQKVLTHLAACYILVKNGKTFLEATPSEQAELFPKLTRPHCVQMLVLFRFLQAHKEMRQGIFDPLWRWIFGPESSAKPQNHLAEVKTGEGKCLLLNITAAFFALRGLKVDIACYQKALMEQDSRAMLEFNEFLEVDQMIRHVTLDDLCQERLDPIVAHSKALLTEELPTARQVRVKDRVLLIDEVDMLFTQRFYGHTWKGGFTLKSPAAKELVKYIFEARSSGDLTTSGRKLGSRLWHSTAGNFELNEAKTQVGYSGIVDIDWSLSHSNKTVFAYLQFAKDGDITPEVAESKIGCQDLVSEPFSRVDLIAGMFSFADLPRSYKYILGVTGTLSELRKIPGLDETLRKDYDFRHFTIAPSIFGLSKLRFRYASDVRLCDNESDWISEIESAIKACTDQGQSVLVFFKSLV
eukprot:s93_g11.t1